MQRSTLDEVSVLGVQHFPDVVGMVEENHARWAGLEPDDVTVVGGELGQKSQDIPPNGEHCSEMNP
jgi:hypothetical protein